MFTFATIFRCVSMTPLGWPVVPDEYTKNARSSAGFTFVLRYLVAPEVFRMLVKCLVLPSGSRSSPIRMILSSGRPTIFAAFFAAPMKGFWVTSAFAPESLSWKASSSGV